MKLSALICLLLVTQWWVSPAHAQSRLCDPSFEDCRTPLLDLIRNESVAIDVAFWFMEDGRYTTELIRRWQAGVPVRVLVDTKANTAYPGNANRIAELREAGIPIRRRTATYMHWKTMIFAGQNVVEFSGANYSPHAFVPVEAYVDYVDEAIVFSHDPSIVNSFKTKYDDAWTATSGWSDYANVTTPRTRSHATWPIHPDLNFPPGSGQNFATRSVAMYDREEAAIETIMYRITDRRHADALIRAVGRGVQARVLTEPYQYRDPVRLWHSWNVDRMYVAGIQIRHRRHRGLNHEKLTLLTEERMAIIGSSNWTESSANSQNEHNWFTREAWVFDWSRAHFDRKWYSETETEPFVPLPPDVPVYRFPANAAADQSTTITFRWHGGHWAHRYDLYVGTDPGAMTRVLDDAELGPSEHATDYVGHTVSGLMRATTYYWQVVSRTMAGLERRGPVHSFRTVGEDATAGAGDVVLWAKRAPVAHGWGVVSDSTAAGGARLSNPNLGAARIASPQASPSQFFEMSFDADAGVPYHLWIRGKSAGNSWRGDSAYVQFSDSVSASGTGVYRIGTTTAATVTIEDCAGCGLSNWGWNDNAYGEGAIGPHIYFAGSGTHTVRVQVREDGLSIDQIVLSRGPFLDMPPGLPRDDGTLLAESGGMSGGEPPPLPPPPATLPAGWSRADVGAVSAAGTAAESDGTFTVEGSGADIWGATDEFHFAHATLTGDGSLTARVASLEYVDAWTKAGVMIRASAAAGAAHGFALVTPGKGVAFQRRTSAGGASTHTAGGSGTAPMWVRITRAGNTITAFRSADGLSWTAIGSDVMPMAADVLIGLAVTSHRDGVRASAVFDAVTLTGGTLPSDPEPSPPPLPEGWTATDVGAVSAQGTATGDGTRFFIEGSGADVWGTADEFHFVHRPLSGDGSLTARVASLERTHDWSKAGVMIRASTAADAPHAFMLVSAARGIAFQRRASPGAVTTHSDGGAGAAPVWLRITRSGDTITGFRSTDGATWTAVGSEVIPMGTDVLIGFAVTSHRDGTLATAVFER